MADQWYYRTAQGEFGPVSMADILGLVREGRLRRDDQIRGARSLPWQTVAEWARQGPGAAPPPGESKLSEAIRQAGEKPKRKLADVPSAKKWLPDRERGTILLGVGVGLLILFEAWWFLTPKLRRYPNPEKVEYTVETPTRLEQFLPRSPRTPRRAVQSAAAPEPVLGLESIHDARTPTLSADLLDIVYTAPQGDAGQLDLFHSQRSSAGEPFATPQRLETCSGPQPEHHPTLAPDGLEIVFCVDLPPSRLYAASRPDKMTPFGAAEPLQTAGIEERFVACDEPQFLSLNEMKVAVATADGKERKSLLLQRGARGQAFRSVNTLPFADQSQRCFVASHRQRVYVLSPLGLQVQVHLPGTTQFLPGVEWLGTKIVGPSGGREGEVVWVSASEDQIFFSSARSNGPRRLWQLRLE
ncbi:MAG: hypothetical protein SFV23_18085 [Planctomycetaceae bacterium]|nr:hypothetical protein [Planctomycetaceae bacterium]